MRCMSRAIIILLISTLILSSCNLFRRTPNRKNVTVDSTDSVAIPEPQVYVHPPDVNSTIAELEHINQAKVALIDSLIPIWRYHKDYTTFKGKAKMHYEGGGQNQDFTANIRMAKDSVIWMHITAGMGLVNVARIYITPDSFQLVNFLGKSAMKLHISEAEQLLPAQIDFNLLQHFIMGEALTESVQEVKDATDFGGTWTLFIKGLQADQHVAINKSDSTIRSQEILSPINSFATVIKYGNYTLVNDRDFAISRAININNKGEMHYVEMNFNGAAFDETMSYPFTIPDSYTLNKDIR